MRDVLESYSKFIAKTYRRTPVVFSRGKGVYLWDVQGKRYVDFVAGIAVCILGHSHPAVIRAVNRQVKKLVHVSNLYYIKEQAELARLLARICPRGIQKFFFCNSGTEAVEAALKLAVKHSGKGKIIAMQGSFHGRTAASLSVTWNPSYRGPFRDLLVKKIQFAKFNDPDSLEKKLKKGATAVIMEPIQAEGGVNVPSEDFLPTVRKMCEEYGVLLILDEIQTGMGRTGKWFACQHWNVDPDEITIAKGLAGGFPIGCLGAKKKVMDSFSPGDHASTFGGNPFVCSVATEVIKTVERMRLPQRAGKMGAFFKKRLQELAERFPSIIKDVRGMGLLLGVEIWDDKTASTIVEECFKRGYLINCTRGNVLRFVPPLIIEEKHINGLTSTLEEVLKGVR